MAKRYNLNLIKSTVSYSTQEIASLFCIHKRTVQQWYQEGLLRIDSRRPFLVRGSDLKDFIKIKQARRKRKCRAEELYCLKCRLPRQPEANLVEIIILNQNQAIIKGLCCKCRTRINRITSVNHIELLKNVFVIQKIRHKDLRVSRLSNSNTDKKLEANHGKM